MTIDGQKAFEIETKNANVFQLPIGVGIAGTFEAAGFDVKPWADFSAVAQMGDTDLDTTIRAAGGQLNASDAASYEMTGDVYGRVSFGVEAQKKNTSFGVSYTGAFGDAGKQSHGLTANVKFMF